MGQELTRAARLRERAMKGVVTILTELEQTDVPERLIAETVAGGLTRYVCLEARPPPCPTRWRRSKRLSGTRKR